MTAVVVPHNFDQINTQILGPSCAAFSVCHSPAGQHDAGMLDLKTDPYKALVGMIANNAKAAGEGQLRVKPCDSAHSFLVFKLTLAANQDATTGYGHYMPDTNPHLPNEQIQAISDWVDRGALKSEPATVTGKTCAVSTDMATTD
ncbi:MAG: hypothetical protein JWM53_448 [bacterium]|nr:hypothetical protein [bacterium]